MKETLKALPVIGPFLRLYRRLHSPEKRITMRNAEMKQQIREIFAAAREEWRMKGLQDAGGKIRLGWVSSWNSKCGIAMYSKFLLDSLLDQDLEFTIFASRCEQPLTADGPAVVRCWDNQKTRDLSPLAEQIAKNRISVLVIQFQFAFFDVEAFGMLLDVLHENSVQTIVIFHATQNESISSLAGIQTSLSHAGALLVHCEKDYERLRSFVLSDNLMLFPHGVVRRTLADPADAKTGKNLAGKTVIASYGFLLPHKGIERLIKAFSLLIKDDPRLHLLLVNAMYPAGTSVLTRSRCENEINALGLRERVTFLTDFMSDEESLGYLACADLIVFPYTHTQESSSAAVRFGLAANRPVACTPLEIFEDVREIVHFLPGTSPEEIARGISELFGNARTLEERSSKQQQWVQSHDWAVVSMKLSALIRKKYNNLLGERTTERTGAPFSFDGESMRGNMGKEMTLERLHERIRADLSEHSRLLVMRNEHVFQYGVVHEDVPVSTRLITAFINWGVRRKAVIRRIPVLHVLAQRIYWKLRSHYFKKVESVK